MPQGQPTVIPDDGLSTRARRNAPVLAVHTGEGKGKSTAAFGMALRAWNSGMNVAVFQFVKSAKWKVGEETAFRELGRLHDEQGIGGAVEWHKMGAGWSWSRPARRSAESRPARRSAESRPARGSAESRPARRSAESRREGSDPDHAATAAEGWAEIARRIAEQQHDFYVLDEFTYPLKWGWIAVDDVVEVLLSRPGTQHIVITGRDAPQRLIDAADLVTEMTKVKHPMDAGRKGQRGIEW
jgi:cob(I)alamin adenosyltransferase